MREILFRGKTLNGNEWVIGAGVYKSEGYTWIITDDVTKTENRGTGSDAISPETVGQFTGLTDKNGKKIFEWDILQFSYTGKNLGVEGKAAVIFENGKFGVLWGWHKEFVCLDGFANTTIEIIGNIHDNPELLGGADNG